MIPENNPHNYPLAWRLETGGYPSLLPVQPFPLYLEQRLDHHLTGASYFGGPGSVVEKNGDYFFFRSNVHGEEEEVVAVKYNNEVRILLTISYNEWKERITWRWIGNYTPGGSTACFFSET